MNGISDLPTLRLEIAKLHVAPGDILVVKVDAALSTETMRSIKVNLEAQLPGGVKSLVFGREFSLSILTQSDVAKLAA